MGLMGCMAVWRRWACRLAALECLCALELCASGCGADHERGLAVSEQPIIYGSDDRAEALLDPDPIAHRAAWQSLALVRRQDLLDSDDDEDAGAPATVASRLGLCDTERFASQPSLAVCTGVLLEEDLVLTAGHCLPSIDRCEELAFVHGYLNGSDTRTVYGCQRVLTRVLQPVSDSRRLDFAVVQLDRPVTNAESTLRPRRLPKPNEPIFTVGASLGAPLKVTRGRVVSVEERPADGFDFVADVFVGGSGSGVFDVEGKLLGIHIRGGADFEELGGCRVARRVEEESPSSREQANLLAPVLEKLCDVAPDRPICATVGEEVSGELERSLDGGVSSSSRDAGLAPMVDADAEAEAVAEAPDDEVLPIESGSLDWDGGKTDWHRRRSTLDPCDRSGLKGGCIFPHRTQHQSRRAGSLRVTSTPAGGCAVVRSAPVGATRLPSAWMALGLCVLLRRFARS